MSVQMLAQDALDASLVSDLPCVCHVTLDIGAIHSSFICLCCVPKVNPEVGAICCDCKAASTWLHHVKAGECCACTSYNVQDDCCRGSMPVTLAVALYSCPLSTILCGGQLQSIVGQSMPALAPRKRKIPNAV